MGRQDEQSSNESITFNVANPFLLGDNTDTWGIIGRAKLDTLGMAITQGLLIEMWAPQRVTLLYKTP